MFLGVFEAKLPDDSSCLLLMTTDDASKYAVAVPVSGRRNISTAAAIEGFPKGWLCWAGPPAAVQFDPAEAFSSARWENFVAEMGARTIPIPAEARWQHGVVERRIGLGEEAFTQIAVEALTQDDDPWIWSMQLNHAFNIRLREGDFPPHQCVFGRDPEVPTSLLNGPPILAPLNLAEYHEQTRRNEEVKRAAEIVVAEADASSRLRHIVLHRSRPLRGP